VVEPNRSSNEAGFPAKLCVDRHSAGQRSVSDNPGDLWHDEIQAGHVRDRRGPVCHFSVTDGRHQHGDEGAMQLAVCSQYCRLCCRIQLQTPGGTLRNVSQSTDHFGTSTGLLTLHGLHNVLHYHSRSQEGALGARAQGRFVSRNPDVMLRAFKVFVRPMLEYAVSVWSPCYNYAIDRVESVQRKFKKRLN